METVSLTVKYIHSRCCFLCLCNFFFGTSGTPENFSGLAVLRISLGFTSLRRTVAKSKLFYYSLDCGFVVRFTTLCRCLVLFSTCVHAKLTISLYLEHYPFNIDNININNKNSAIANRSCVSCAHNMSRASIGLITYDLEF